MSESAIILPPLGTLEHILLWSVLGSALIGLLYGLHCIFRVIRRDRGTDEMIEVAHAIEVGAMAYLKRQFNLMIWFVLAITVGLFFMYRPLYAGTDGHIIPLHLGVALAFLMGVTASYSAGFVGMWLAVKGNVRTAAEALKSFKGALELAFSAGTVSGMFTLGFGLAGATIIFLLFKEDAMKVLIGFGFGGSLAALFMRMGGGIYTKSADVGADLVGKIEAGIPEDDPRNPATIADNVGDNVGDCAGMAADVFESYEVTLVAAIILAVGALMDPGFRQIYGEHAGAMALKMIIYPLLIRAVGVFSSIAGTLSVRARESKLKDPMRPIQIGYWIAGLTSIAGFAVVTYFYLIDPTTGAPDWRFFWATSMGIGLAIVTLAITNRFTHPDKSAATETALATKTGPATAFLAGLGVGLESTTWAIISIAGTIAASVVIFGGNVALSSYGIALAGLGLLTTTGFILAMDTYGPITDNAHGIFEMSGYTEDKLGEAGRNLSWLDAIGNTTKALTKGLAIATAVIAAISLFRSYNAEAMLERIGIQVNLPMVFVGFLIGGAVPFLFSSFALKAVERGAFLVVE
jgi:K(+)-stimulated pyrophosphate-energized sodium pump